MRIRSLLRVGGHRRRRVLMLASGLFVVGLFALSGWTRLVGGSSFCTKCHEMEPAALTAGRSTHADVPCIACHEGSGLLGALAYAPSLARESLHKLVGFGAGGVLKAKPCSGCHRSTTSSGVLAAKGGHPGSKSDCKSCHGQVAHLVAAPATASTPTAKPHPTGWVGRHGAAATQRGVGKCATCHPPVLCKSCHGTEIPHKSDWLKKHVRDERTGRACFTCHVSQDCESCHARHGIHPEQGLYR
ncbi:MAG: hypothetical protein WDA27_09765 [Actinomycetota bacterium]